MGRDRAIVRFFRDLAAHHQYRHHHRYFSQVFVLHNSQNRDGAAIQAKLDELIRVSEGSNSFVGIEHLTHEEIEEIRSKCEQRAAAAAGTRRSRVTHNA